MADSFLFDFANCGDPAYPPFARWILDFGERFKYDNVLIEVLMAQDGGKAVFRLRQGDYSLGEVRLPPGGEGHLWQILEHLRTNSANPQQMPVIWSQGAMIE